MLSWCVVSLLETMACLDHATLDYCTHSARLVIISLCIYAIGSGIVFLGDHSKPVGLSDACCLGGIRWRGLTVLQAQYESRPGGGVAGQVAAWRVEMTGLWGTPCIKPRMGGDSEEEELGCGIPLSRALANCSSMQRGAHPRGGWPTWGVPLHW